MSSSKKYNTQNKKTLEEILKNASVHLTHEHAHFKIPDLSNLQSLLSQITKDVKP